MTELKPCPFCGGEAETSGGRERAIAVWCVDCGATINKPAEETAIAAWNTRAELGSVTLTAEQVREIVEDNTREYSSPTDPYVYLHEHDWQAIADELNAALGSSCESVDDVIATPGCGECEMKRLERYDGMDPAWRCLSCGHDTCEDNPRFCPHCGKAVKR